MTRLLNYCAAQVTGTLRCFLHLIVVAGLITTSPALYALDKVRLQLRFDDQYQFAGYYAAQWQGYYAEAGLEVEILPGIRTDGSMVAVTDVIKHGAAEFGIGAGDIYWPLTEAHPSQLWPPFFNKAPLNYSRVQKHS